MTSRTALLTGFAALCAIGALAVWQVAESPSPRLSLLLRCEDGVSGTIAVAGGGVESRRPADANKACATGSIDFLEYEQGRDLAVTFVPGGAEPSELEVVYGRDIQTAPEGFFAVVTLRAAVPFIANDRL